MQLAQDQWIWYVDDELVPALLEVEPANAEFKRRSLCSPAFVRAVRLHREGRREEAMAELRSGASDRRHAGECHAAIGHIQFEQGRYPEAAQSYEQAAEANPPHPAARFNHALCLERMRRYREAAVVFEKAALADSGRLEPLLGLAHCLLSMRAVEPALHTFERCLELNPESDVSRFGRAVALQLLERYDEAVEVYGVLLERESLVADALSNLISIAMARGDLAAARGYAERLQAVRPDHRAAVEGLAAAALAAQDYGAAARHCAKLTEVEPEMMEAWYNLGVASQRLGRLEWATRALTRASELRPDQAVIHTSLGAVLRQKGDWVGAARAFALALKVAPQHLDALWGQAQAQEELGDAQAAERTVQSILEQTAESTEGWFRLGWLRAKREDWAGAADAFERCVWLRDNWADAHMNLGIARLRLGALEEARAAFRRTYDLAGESSDVVRALAYLSLAAGDVGRAGELEADLHTRKGEDTSDLLFRIGEAHRGNGDAHSASENLRQAVEQQPRHTRALVNLGHALLDLGKGKEAEECWKMARESDPALARKR